MEDTKWCVAHEIGHCFGLIHAELRTSGNPNPAFLPYGNAKKRLMYGRTLLEDIIPRPTLLIKSEWDVIHHSP